MAWRGSPSEEELEGPPPLARATAIIELLGKVMAKTTQATKQELKEVRVKWNGGGSALLEPCVHAAAAFIMLVLLGGSAAGWK